ncbi:MAG: hypothetical protein K2J72_07065 [Oscillospiraceae bacterium]|nr:hypothetical protein [Oscillospiraceae bacterium]
MDFSRQAKIVSVNLRYNFLPHFAIACVIALAVPTISSISSLTERGAAQPLEYLLSFAGAFLLTPIFYPEQNKNVRDLIRSKRTGYLSVCFVRVVYSAAALALVVGAMVLAMKLCESAVTWRHFVGGYASALLLGSVGLFFAGASGNVTAGYMAAVIYYLASYAMKDKLGAACIFSMMLGMDFSYKYGSLVIAALVTAAGFFAVHIKSGR